MRGSSAQVGNCFRGMAGAVKVGCVNRVERHFGKPFGQAFQLRWGTVGQQRVVLPVAAAVNVAFGFGMPH